jgi:hypothetical protein
MEANELKLAWQGLEKALERSNQLNEAILRNQNAERARKKLRPLKWNQAFQIVCGVVFILFAAALWSTKPSAASVIVAGVLVQVYGIGCIITAGVTFAALKRVDYSAPVVEVQSGLARVRHAYGICVMVAGLSWWFLWVPLLMVMAGLLHVNLYAHAPSVVWIGLAIAAVGLAGTYWVYVASQRSSNERFRLFVEKLTFGSSLLAKRQLDEVQRFEEELAA